MEDLSIFEIVGQRYLDTQHDDEYLARLDDELARRRIVGLRRWAVEYVAASSLWWNVIWWDWVSLDEEDVRLGWRSNIIVFGAAALVAGVVSQSFLGGIAVFVGLHILTTWIGFGLRRGTKRR